ncbi:outer membrane protein assembly factor BamE [Aquincola sp. S2]|uniref:Outer membrane protein assembly factor BamE n=1 Tax=Pseudaquabacterium terrae TaxID=2732868 RepID=A0ABX2EAW4_9BURK|nr:outer membrane protein assembly factor BamE [Aquabacterium terrae]NRF66246.1 outer membrane protein assembly factor BamE [Aquabacterium terrae]
MTPLNSARRLGSPFLLFALLALGACSSLQSSDSNFLGVITPYRIDIVQGNVVTQEQVAQIKPGMTRDQVRDILGSPMLTDIFHADRWDYVFTIKRPGTEPQRRSVIATFEGNALKKLDAPALPSERDFVASISRTKATGKTPVLELTDAQKSALPRPARSEAPPVEPAGAVRSYPPLEPS